MQVCKISRRQFYRGGAESRLSPRIHYNGDRSALRAMRASYNDDGHGQTSAHVRTAIAPSIYRSWRSPASLYLYEGGERLAASVRRSYPAYRARPHNARLLRNPA